jgi:GNAT superfamily N-acetyltransferase
MSAPLALPETSPETPFLFRLEPAAQYSIEQLTAAYNQTRVDYLVPMPMNAARLAEYVHHYDVDLAHSFVAEADGQMLGLGMLGVRPRATWVTRLGVLPVERRNGVGRAILQSLLDASEQLGRPQTILEVIQNNTPAHQLFLANGFKEARELVVLRRPPGPPPFPPPGEARWLERAEALALLAQRLQPESWITDTPSLVHVDNLMGFVLTLPAVGRGWLIFEHQRHGKFIVVLARLALRTEAGDPVQVGQALLAHLYRRFPDLDTHTENIDATNPHLPALHALGYVESFRRIEMCRARGAGGPAA